MQHNIAMSGIKRLQQAITLAILKSSVKVGSQTVVMMLDPMVLFSGLVVLTQRTLTFQDIQLLSWDQFQLSYQERTYCESQVSHLLQNALMPSAKGRERKRGRQYIRSQQGKTSIAFAGYKDGLLTKEHEHAQRTVKSRKFS